MRDDLRYGHFRYVDCVEKMTNTALSNEVRAYVALRDWLVEQHNLPPEDQAILDSLEGATNLHEMIGALARQARYRAANAEALATIIGENKKRKARDEQAVETIRRIIAQAMMDAGLKKLTAPDATLSVRMGESKPKIVSEDMLPEWAWKERTIREPDMAQITHVMMAEKHALAPIAGVVMTNPTPILMIRPT